MTNFMKEFTNTIFYKIERAYFMGGLIQKQGFNVAV